MKHLFKEIKSDLPASIVVFFVAVPLCLGIALASGAPLFAGIISGIIGGIVVGMTSGSPLGVSGPAAGLAVIVLTSIASLGGSYEAFLTAVVLAGIMQLALGYAKAGFIAYFFPSSVIKGMLTGIGILIILKQIPHAIGWDKDTEGNTTFSQADGQNTFSEIALAFQNIFSSVTQGAVLIGVVSVGILILWDKVLSKKSKVFNIINGPLVVVVFGIIMFNLYQNGIFGLSLNDNQVVAIPVPHSISDFFGQFTLPNFASITNFEVWKIAIVLAIVASLETLLCVDATDRMDPYKRVTPTNLELKAQGLGNVLSGLIGGLPVTQVIVRSSANISFGAKTKMSAILHGVLLLLSAVTIASILNMIPLASLAAILLMVGYKLAKPSLFKDMYKLGWEQFMPFMATIIGILLTDLLIGITIGLMFGIFYTLRHSYRNSHHLKDTTTTINGQNVHHIELAQEVSFFNKASVMRTFEEIPNDTKVIIDCTNSKSIAYDVLELINDFEIQAKIKNISIEKINFKEPI